MKGESIKSARFEASEALWMVGVWGRSVLSHQGNGLGRVVYLSPIFFKFLV